MPRDSDFLREILVAHYPGIEIWGTAKESGQRVVYFCRFRDFERPRSEENVSEFCCWSDWGDVVVKVGDGSNPSAVARSQQEISVLKEISSPYYPTLCHFELLTFDPSKDEPLSRKLYVTIEEKIVGRPLSECLDSFKTESAVIKLLIDLVSGLNVLWSGGQKYVHRDIKPDNILVRDNGGIVIIDLGLLRESGAKGVTATIANIGPCTPAFASPEQAKNQKLDISYKSDMFSIGVLAYTLLSGQNPFVTRDEISWEEVLANVVSIAPPPLNSIANVSNGLSLIVEKLMEKEPYQRYRRPERLFNDLRELL
ncbi:serine/threonine-protein kinase [Microbulbifer sp. SA54]|uniref:serine/threonine-protein kinase n=1 Tax=Microbulbifer sp. SA54 TaxID=3401577 RepID=UPI003AADDCBA